LAVMTLYGSDDMWRYAMEYGGNLFLCFSDSVSVLFLVAQFLCLFEDDDNMMVITWWLEVR
jgi:hypothetical protein